MRGHSSYVLWRHSVVDEASGGNRGMAPIIPDYSEEVAKYLRERRDND